jgi:hypothetical protein
MPMSNGLAIDDTTTVKTDTKQSNRDCQLVEDCDFYAWFINDGDYGIPGFPKEKVDTFLREAECGLDEEGNVLKGKKMIRHNSIYVE